MSYQDTSVRRQAADTRSPVQVRLSNLEAGPLLAIGHGDTISLKHANLISTSAAPTTSTIGGIDYEHADVTLPAGSEGDVFMALVSPENALRLLGAANGETDGVVIPAGSGVLHGRRGATDWTITGLAEATVEPGDGLGIPAYTRRTNRRYISATGSDAASGLTSSTPWASLRPHVTSGDLPADTEVIVLDGTLDLSTALLWSDIPANITLRSDTFRGATIRGPASPAAADDGIAVYGYGTVDDLEIYGLRWDRWQQPTSGAAMVLLESAAGGGSDGFRFIGNVTTDVGAASNVTQTIYFSNGTTLANSHKNWTITHNNFTPGEDSKAVIQIFGGTYGAHDGEVAYNTVRTAGIGVKMFMIVSNTRPDGVPSNIHVHDNDIVGTFLEAIFGFGDYDSENGVDATFLVEDNVLTQLSSLSNDLIAQNFPVVTDAGKADHLPLFRTNTISRPNYTGGASMWLNIAGSPS